MRIRPFLPQDREQLDEFAAAYPEATIEMPHGYELAPVVETAVALRDDATIIGSLTKTLIASIDPFISDPASTPREKALALRQLSRALEYQALKDGAIEVFTAVPPQLVDYHEVLTHNGWERTARECFIFRKPLVGGV